MVFLKIQSFQSFQSFSQSLSRNGMNIVTKEGKKRGKVVGMSAKLPIFARYLKNESDGSEN